MWGCENVRDSSLQSESGLSSLVQALLHDFCIIRSCSSLGLNCEWGCFSRVYTEISPKACPALIPVYSSISLRTATSLAGFRDHPEKKADFFLSCSAHSKLKPTAGTNLIVQLGKVLLWCHLTAGLYSSLCHIHHSQSHFPSLLTPPAEPWKICWLRITWDITAQQHISAPSWAIPAAPGIAVPRDHRTALFQTISLFKRNFYSSRDILPCIYYTVKTNLTILVFLHLYFNTNPLIFLNSFID